MPKKSIPLMSNGPKRKTKNVQLQPRYQPGDRIGGRYLVHQALMGGMSEVYLCLDLQMTQPCALKTFQARYLTSQKLREAFNTEVATWIALEKHLNIVRCFYLETLDSQPFMILEWVANDESCGTDLRSWLQHGPLDLQLVLDFAIDICRGLIHAGEKQPGIVHRDLKPENILVAQRRVAKITDFGVAKTVQDADLEVVDAEAAPDGHQSLLSTSGVVGTPPYMSPEQWRAEELDVRADIYAIGCMLYEMLTGRCPFETGTVGDLRRQHLEAAVPTLTTDDALPTALVTLLARCLAKRRDERFATVGDLLQELALIYQQQFAEAPRAIVISQEFMAVDYANRGLTYARLRRYDEALADYARAIQLDPTLAQVYSNRGVAYDSLQRYDEALADYTRAIQLDSAYAPAYNNRGVTYDNLQRYDKALADFTRAIQIDPTFAQAYSNRGRTYTGLQRYDEALADFTRAIQLDPTATTYTNRGLTHARMRRYEESLADFTRAIQLDPAYVQACTNRGVAYERLGRYDEAMADHTYAIQIDPTDAQAYYNRGVTYERLQRCDEALADFNRAIQIDPTHALAYRNVGALLANRGVLWEALLYFEKAARLGAPQGAQYAARVRQMLGITSGSQIHPTRLALEAFQHAGSPDEMQRAVAQFPFMTGSGFIAAVEQVAAQEVLSDINLTFEQRLAWLRQIAND